LLLTCTTAFSQLSFAPPERVALNSLEKKNWDKARTQLTKALRKDTINAAARYVLACYFAETANPAHHLDSAHLHTALALADLQKTDFRGRERLKRFPLDSTILIHLSQRVDSAAFEKARELNTEEAYVHFLDVYTAAAERPQAIELRDEVAYLAALRDNTYTAFAAFLQKYPNSSRATDVKARYEKTLYQVKTKSHRLADYETFLREYPATTYRHDAERQIFELMTIAGTPEAFRRFLTKYPRSSAFTYARNMLYYMLFEKGSDRGLDQTLDPFWDDSLRHAAILDKQYLVPFYKDGRYGFLDQQGLEAIPPSSTTLDPAYDCGNITDDLLLVSDKVITKTNTISDTGHFTALDDIGFGFVLAETEKGYRLFHKSAGTIFSHVDDARLLDGRFLAVKTDTLWSLHTLTGRKLNVAAYDDIAIVGNALILRRDNRYEVGRTTELSAEPDAGPITLMGKFEEVKPWPHHSLWIRTDNHEGVIDSAFHESIRTGRHHLQPIPAGALATSESGYSFFTRAGQSVYFRNAVLSDPWTAVRHYLWRLYDPATGGDVSPAYDTITFAGPFAIGHLGDTLAIHFTPTAPPEIFTSAPSIAFMPGKDSTAFLVLTEGEKKTIYNSEGQKLFMLSCDQIAHAGGDIFVITRKDRSRKDQKGLVGKGGKLLLPAEFDAIGSIANGSVSLLKDRRFGLFDVAQQRQIKPVYDKNINRYARDYLTTVVNGKYGFVSWDNKPIGTFDFDEVRYWNDSVSWVRKSYQWMLYNIRSQKVVEAHVAGYKLVSDLPGENIAIISQEGHYGVISSTRGEIIPATLSRIINVGSVEHPMYLTAKHVEEASIYVVIYYDQNGAVLKRQVYEEEDYEHIRCLQTAN
jgi:outer membrane protein assembly factor BamD (BamD/ComL family)